MDEATFTERQRDRYTRRGARRAQEMRDNALLLAASLALPVMVGIIACRVLSALG